MGVSARSRTARQLAWASLAANVGIVLTGGAVRLTGSGLGCPTWPRCTDQSFVPHGELGVHGVIEFGNRLLTLVLVAVAIGTWVAVRRLVPARPGSRRTATWLALGVPAQALLGGVTVLTDLNPWVVALHLMLSMLLIAWSVLLIRQLRDVPGHAAAAPLALTWLVRGTYGLVWLVLYAGTVVTGSGPHAGDLTSPRNGLDPAAASQLHADLVFLLVGLTVGVLAAGWGVGAPRVARAAGWLLGVELAQGAVGLVQYATDLPLALVATHLLGASVLTAAATWLWLETEDSRRTDRAVTVNRGSVPVSR